MLWLLEHLVPTFAQIHPHDDTTYIRSGHWLVDHGVLREIAWGPLLSLLHGLVYALVQESPNWFVWTAAGGRLATYGLFCMGIYLCARTFVPNANPWAIVVLGLTWPIAASFFVVWNSSDCLFMALSALALSRMLAYVGDRSLRHLAWGSTLVGGAALTRPDGLVLLLSFAILAYATYARAAGAWYMPLGWPRPLIAAVAPAILLVGGYLTLYGLATGSWEMGTMSRTYVAFEQGHGVIFRERYSGSGNIMVAGYEDVRALFGTRADNDHSVFRAVARNPIAFLQRVARSVGQFPTKVSWAFGGPLAAILLFLAMRGIVSIWHTGPRWTLAVLVGWHVHMLSYFVTFWRPGYLRFAFAGLALLAGAGAVAIARHWDDHRERVVVGMVVAGLAAWMLWDDGGNMWRNANARTSDMMVVLLLGMCLFVLTLAPSRWRRTDGKLLSLLVGVGMTSAVAAAAGLSPIDHLPLRIGESPQEKAVSVAATTTPPGTRIAARGGKLQAAARRVPYALPYSLLTASSPEAWDEWQARTAVGAIYLSPFTRQRHHGAFDHLIDRLQGDPKWALVFSEPASHTWLYVRPSLLRLMEGSWRSGNPALLSEFDVFLLDDLLVYVKDSCRKEHVDRRFFVHVAPVDQKYLHERQKARGLANFDFDFADAGVREAGQCVATRLLPRYPISYIATGQYLPGEGRFWQGRIDFSEKQPQVR